MRTIMCGLGSWGAKRAVQAALRPIKSVPTVLPAVSVPALPVPEVARKVVEAEWWRETLSDIGVVEDFLDWYRSDDKFHVLPSVEVVNVYFNVDVAKVKEDAWRQS